MEWASLRAAPPPRCLSDTRRDSGGRGRPITPATPRARRYIFIYSITSRVSFEVVKAIHEKLLMNLGVNTLSSCILVGNKLDLAPSR